MKTPGSKRLIPAWFQRQTAVMVCVTLLFSNTPARAQSAPLKIVSKPDAAVSSEWGHVDEVQKSGPKRIIFIQDAHDSIEAQVNIAAIIKDWVENQGVQTVYEEGYEGRVPGDDYFGALKDPDVREKVSYYLMDQLRIGGAEYAYINRQKDFELIGSDNAKQHFENVQWYRKTAVFQKEAARDLGVLRQEILRLANRNFPAQLKNWMRLKERLDENRLSFGDYLQRLPDISADLFNQGKLTESAAKRYPSLAVLYAAKEREVQRDEALENLDAKALFKETSDFENEIAGKFLKNERDRKTFAFYKALQLLSRLNALEVSSEEYAALRDNVAGYTTDDFARFIVRYRKKSVVISRRWESNIQNAMRFYETAELRDQAVEESLLSFQKKKDQDTAVLVFGGFHQRAIKNLLRKHGFSYQIISPKISKVEESYRVRYQQRMTEGVDSRFSIQSLAATATRPPSDLAVVRLSPGYRLAFSREIDLLADAAAATRTSRKPDILLEMRRNLKNTLQAGRSELRSEEGPKPERLTLKKLEKAVQALMRDGLEVGGNPRTGWAVSTEERRLHSALYDLKRALEERFPTYRYSIYQDYKTDQNFMRLDILPVKAGGKRSELREPLPGEDETLRMLDRILSAHPIPYHRVQDNAIYVPTPLALLPHIFDVFKSFGDLQERNFLEIGSGDGRNSLFAALEGMNVTAIERDSNIAYEAESVLADAAKQLPAAGRVKLITADALAPETDADWQAADLIFFFYTEPDNPSKAAAFREALQEKMRSQMKAGARLVLLLTEKQLATEASSGSELVLRNIPEFQAVTEALPMAGFDVGFNLQIYTAARSELRSEEAGGGDAREKRREERRLRAQTEKKIRAAKQVFRKRMVFMGFTAAALSVGALTYWMLPKIPQNPAVRAPSEEVLERQQFGTIRGIPISDTTPGILSQEPELIDAIAEGTGAADRVRRSQIARFELVDGAPLENGQKQSVFRVEPHPQSSVDPAFEDVPLRQGQDGKINPLDLEGVKNSVSGGRIVTVTQFKEWMAWAPLALLGIGAILAYAFLKGMRRVDTGSILDSKTASDRSTRDIQKLRAAAEKKRQEKDEGGGARSEMRMFVNDMVRQQFAIAGVRFLDEHIPTDRGVFRPTLSGLVDELAEYAESYEPIRIIDLGSGQGAMVFAFARANDYAQVLGIEYDEALFEDSVKVHKSFFEETKKRIRLERGDFNDPKFAEDIQKADLINYWETGSIAEDTMLRTLGRNMRPGARFLLTKNSGRIIPSIQNTGYFDLVKHDPDNGIFLFKRNEKPFLEEAGEAEARSELRSENAPQNSETWQALKQSLDRVLEIHPVENNGFYDMAAEEGFFNVFRRFLQGYLQAEQVLTLPNAGESFEALRGQLAGILGRLDLLMDLDYEAFTELNPRAASATFSVLAVQMKPSVLEDETVRHLGFGDVSIKQLVEAGLLKVDVREGVVVAHLPDIKGILADQYPVVMREELEKIQGQLNRFMTEFYPQRSELRTSEGLGEEANLRALIEASARRLSWPEKINLDVDPEIKILTGRGNVSTVLFELIKNAVDGSRVYKKKSGEKAEPDVWITAEQTEDWVSLHITNWGILAVDKLRSQARQEGVWKLRPYAPNPSLWPSQYIMNSRMPDEPMPYSLMSPEQVDALPDDVFLFHIQGLTLRSDENLARIGMKRSDLNGGMGIGLKQSWSIMQAVDPERPITYSSGSEAGSPTVTFSVRFPAVGPVTDLENELPELKAEKKGPITAVVIADDDRGVRLMLRTQFRDYPALTIAEALNGDEAYEKVRQLQAVGENVLLVTDGWMPKADDGAKLVGKLRSEGIQVPVIYHSSSKRPELPGNVAFLTKGRPETLPDFKTLIRALLETPLRSELRETSPGSAAEMENLSLEKMTVPAAVFLDARELMRLSEEQADERFDELLTLLERHPAFDLYIDQGDQVPLHNIQISKLRQILSEFPQRVHLGEGNRANLAKKKTVIQVSFFAASGTAEDTRKLIQDIRLRYKLQNDPLPIEYLAPGALKGFLGLAESFTPAELIREIGEAYAVRSAGGRWQLAADFAASLWTRIRSDYTIQWSA